MYSPKYSLKNKRYGIWQCVFFGIILTKSNYYNPAKSLEILYTSYMYVPSMCTVCGRGKKNSTNRLFSLSSQFWCNTIKINWPHKIYIERELLHIEYCSTDYAAGKFQYICNMSVYKTYYSIVLYLCMYIRLYMYIENLDLYFIAKIYESHKTQIWNRQFRPHRKLLVAHNNNSRSSNMLGRLCAKDLNNTAYGAAANTLYII